MHSLFVHDYSLEEDIYIGTYSTIEKVDAAVDANRKRRDIKGKDYELFRTVNDRGSISYWYSTTDKEARDSLAADYTAVKINLDRRVDFDLDGICERR